jgi:hypothetical protein
LNALSPPLTRLQAEWLRLFGVSPAPNAGELIGADGQVRAMVLALGQPADWSLVAAVWQGVQADLGWPAPAIAVSGTEAYQLWFSLAQAVPAAEAHAVLEALCARHLVGVHPSRLSLWPAPDAASPSGWRHADPVPACMPNGACWSAFVAPDLAPVFADTPWLDLPPGLDGQADLLSRHKSIPQRDLHRIQVRAEPAAANAGDLAPALLVPTSAQTDPRQFLLDAMNNPALDWALRIEAAKALLP